jgi:hypothetical protein
VTFNLNLTRCVAQATVGSGQPAFPPGGGNSFEHGDSANATLSGNDVRVLTGTPTGPLDDGFMLAVVC